MSSVLVTVAGPQDDLEKAAKKLADAGGYSWSGSVEGSRFGRDTKGQIDKEGLARVTATFRDNEIVSVHKGEKAAIKLDDGWRSAAELENAEGRERFWAGMLRRFKAPAEQAVDLVKKSDDLSLADGVYSGKLTKAGATELLSFRGRGDDDNISGASGSVKFWVKDGMLSKYEFRVKGNVTFGDNDRDVDRTTTIVISKVGETTVQIPAGAKSKL